MGSHRVLRIEVVYAHAARQYLVRLELLEGTTAAEAVRCSGVLARVPEAETACCRLGVSGRAAAPGQALHDGDRVEIYRPLRADPKLARRIRARRTVRPPR